MCNKKAAWYPDKPSREDERMMTQFMNAFARFYPCVSNSKYSVGVVSCCPLYIRYFMFAFLYHSPLIELSPTTLLCWRKQTYCAKDFQDNLAKSPVKARSREDLSMWLCEQHNLLNEKLGKDLFKCDMKTLDERWRKSSDPRCES